MIDIFSTLTVIQTADQAEATKASTNNDLLDQDDDLTSSSSTTEAPTPVHKPPVRSLAALRGNRRTVGRNPRTVRSLSPKPRSRSAPDHPRRAQSPTRSRKTPARSFSANAAVQLLDMFGIQTEEKFPEQDDDNFDDYKVKECEVRALVNNREEFLRLKMALKEKGAITNEVLRQRLHVYMRKNRNRLQSSSEHSDDNVNLMGHSEQKSE